MDLAPPQTQCSNHNELTFLLRILWPEQTVRKIVSEQWVWHDNFIKHLFPSYCQELSKWCLSKAYEKHTNKDFACIHDSIFFDVRDWVKPLLVEQEKNILPEEFNARSPQISLCFHRGAAIIFGIDFSNFRGKMR